MQFQIARLINLGNSVAGARNNVWTIHTPSQSSDKCSFAAPQIADQFYDFTAPKIVT